MTNDEGGTDNEEFRVAAVIDRVNTTWGTLMKVLLLLVYNVMVILMTLFHRMNTTSFLHFSTIPVTKILMTIIRSSGT